VAGCSSSSTSSTSPLPTQALPEFSAAEFDDDLQALFRIQQEKDLLRQKMETGEVRMTSEMLVEKYEGWLIEVVDFQKKYSGRFLIRNDYSKTLRTPTLRDQLNDSTVYETSLNEKQKEELQKLIDGLIQKKQEFTEFKKTNGGSALVVDFHSPTRPARRMRPADPSQFFDQKIIPYLAVERPGLVRGYVSLSNQPYRIPFGDVWLAASKNKALQEKLMIPDSALHTHSRCRSQKLPDPALTSTCTNARGEFEFSKLPPGRYVVSSQWGASQADFEIDLKSEEIALLEIKLPSPDALPMTFELDGVGAEEFLVTGLGRLGLSKHRTQEPIKMRMQIFDHFSETQAPNDPGFLMARVLPGRLKDFLQTRPCWSHRSKKILPQCISEEDEIEWPITLDKDLDSLSRQRSKGFVAVNHEGRQIFLAGQLASDPLTSFIHFNFYGNKNTSSLLPSAEQLILEFLVLEALH
jgi:hypothetical protein